MHIVYRLENLNKCKITQCYLYPMIIIFQRLLCGQKVVLGAGSTCYKSSTVVHLELASYLTNSTANYDHVLPCACI